MTPLLAAAIEQVRCDVDGTVHVVRDQGDAALLLVVPRGCVIGNLSEFVANMVLATESKPQDELMLPDLSEPHLRLLDVKRYNFPGSPQ